MSVVCVSVFQIRDATRTDFTLGWTGEAQADGTASEGDDLQRSAEFRFRCLRGGPGNRDTRPGTGITTLLLQGDRQEFDNRHYVVTVELACS